jgi:hypothetical protein
MKTLYFITIMFFNASGDPVMVDGWYPLEVPTLERCEASAKRVEEYLQAMTKDGKISNFSSFEVTCEVKQIK